jgi:hypothetical protein
MKGGSRLQPGTWRRLLVGAFVLYLYGVLGYLGVSHSHPSEASHQDCQLCHISSQPSLAEAPKDLPQTFVFAFDYSPGAASALLAPRHASFSSRGPPSV